MYIRSAEILYYTINTVALVVCLLATSLVIRLKLYRKVVYRLSLYQVLASLLRATMSILSSIVSANYAKNPHIFGSLCTAAGWFTMYSQWMKLLFTMWITFHIFYFAVLQKNVKRFEVLYLMTSLLVPAVIASVPLITHTYSPIGYCYISAENDTNHVALIENLALWDGPAILVLLAASTSMVVMVTKLFYRIRWRSIYEPITGGDQYWKALKQLLPLTAFPMLFFAFIIPLLVFDIYVAVDATFSTALELTVLACIPLWSLTSGATLLIHISVARCRARRKMRVNSHRNANDHLLHVQGQGVAS